MSWMSGSQGVWKALVGGIRLAPLINFGEGSEDTEGLVM